MSSYAEVDLIRFTGGEHEGQYGIMIQAVDRLFTITDMDGNARRYWNSDDHLEIEACEYGGCKPEEKPSDEMLATVKRTDDWLSQNPYQCVKGIPDELLPKLEAVAYGYCGRTNVRIYIGINNPTEEQKAKGMECLRYLPRRDRKRLMLWYLREVPETEYAPSGMPHQEWMDKVAKVIDGVPGELLFAGSRERGGLHCPRFDNSLGVTIYKEWQDEEKAIYWRVVPPPPEENAGITESKDFLEALKIGIDLSKRIAALSPEEKALYQQKWEEEKEKRQAEQDEKRADFGLADLTDEEVLQKLQNM